MITRLRKRGSIMAVWVFTVIEPDSRGESWSDAAITDNCVLNHSWDLYTDSIDAQLERLGKGRRVMQNIGRKKSLGWTATNFAYDKPLESCTLP